MAIFANSTDKSAPRGFPWMWYIRLAQILLTLIVLAIAGRVAAAISDSDGCHVPRKVAWNIVCVCSFVINRGFFWILTTSIGCTCIHCPDIFSAGHRPLECIQSPSLAYLDSTWSRCLYAHNLDSGRGDIAS